jgi:peptidoglycan/LPS O-acetylase OafA/YrhL
MADPKRHIEFLDQVRGIAIVVVFLFHALGTACGYEQLPWGHCFRDFSVSQSFLLLLPFSFGWSGVAIFFVVSGFCIHLSFKRKADWPDFFVRRFFRIYPPICSCGTSLCTGCSMDADWLLFCWSCTVRDRILRSFKTSIIAHSTESAQLSGASR